MSQWVNKYTIMRDLSRAQGRVPGELGATVFHGDRPPSPNIVEETEEEYYRSYMGEGDISAPDLGLIKQMIDAVRDQDRLGENDSDDKLIEISKLNPLCSDFYPRDVKKVAEENNTFIQQKTKTKRHNVAITSLLNKFGKENITKLPTTTTTNNNNELKLRKPEHFSDNVPEGVRKVYGWLENQEKAPESHKNKNKKQNINLELNPASMFKKKASPPKTKEKTDFLSSDFRPSAIKRIETSTPEPKEAELVKGCGSYVPSEKAKEYYKKFLQSSKMKEMLHDNVWTQAERQMKDLDDRRKIEADLFAASLALSKTQLVTAVGSPGGIENKILDVVRLPKHRHLLTGDCIVCFVQNKASSDTTIASTPISTTTTTDISWRHENNHLDTNGDSSEVSWRQKCIKLDMDNNLDCNEPGSEMYGRQESKDLDTNEVTKKSLLKRQSIESNNNLDSDGTGSEIIWKQSVRLDTDNLDTNNSSIEKWSQETNDLDTKGDSSEILSIKLGNNLDCNGSTNEVSWRKQSIELQRNKLESNDASSLMFWRQQSMTMDTNLDTNGSTNERSWRQLSIKLDNNLDTSSEVSWPQENNNLDTSESTNDIWRLENIHLDTSGSVSE